MTNPSHPLARDELIHSITVFSGWATSDGLIGGTTIEDTKLIGLNDFVTGKAILIMSGPRAWEMKIASLFVPGTGTITIPAFSGQITAGIHYRILTVGTDLAGLLASLAALQADVGDASASTLGSLLAILGDPDIDLATRIGNPDADTLTSLVDKLGDLAIPLAVLLGARWDGGGDLGTDIATILAGLLAIYTNQGDPSGDTLIDTTQKLGDLARSLAALLGTRWDGGGDIGADILAIINASSAAAAYAIINSGLSFRAVVTSKVGCGVNDFICGTLAGVGEGAFVDATAPYRVFVFMKADGTMTTPHGETQNVTAYVSSGVGAGKFTTGAFGAEVVVGDTVIIMHPRIAELASILSYVSRSASVLDFWSASQEEAALSDVAAPGTDVTLPSVVVAGLPAGCAIIRAVVMFKFRSVENTNVAANALQGAQSIEVDDSVATGYLAALSFVDNEFTLAASTREGGDVFIGSIDVKARVDGNDTYSVKWTAALVDMANLQFNDVQVGLRIWFR